MTRWTDTRAPRIWRSPESNFNGDEPLDASRIYTSEVLGAIKSHGFNGIWMRGRLYELMQSTILPQLNDSKRDQRIQSLRQVIERGQRQGIGAYLFFNEPLALPEDHPLWQSVPELDAGKGATAADFNDNNTTLRALCTSSLLVQQFVQQAVESLLQALPELAGVILITASEHFSHCWSHTFRYSLDDGVKRSGAKLPDCQNCKDREPAEIVLALLRTWRDAARDHASNCRVLAWNWSWSMWYPDPQPQIVSHLPQGVDLLVDWERGGKQVRSNQTVLIDEYSLGYTGPSERFTTAKAAASNDAAIHAKLQIGTTHEIATVPNLPLIESLHAKLVGMTQHGIVGTMACWNFGCSLTLNTFALKLYQASPERYAQADTFLDDLARQYFGLDDPKAVRSAWRKFQSAFTDHYPFSIAFLYWSPINDAPAHPLSLRYQAKPLGPSWLGHEFGDDITNCLGPCSIHQVVAQLEQLTKQWNQGLTHYEHGLVQSSPAPTPPQHIARMQEYSCARMIGLQMRSATNFFRFHKRRLELSNDPSQACTLPADEQLLAIMRAEIANARAALPWVEADDRLGVHQECHERMYDAPLIRTKIAAMERELSEA